MKRARLTEEQIISILKQAKAGVRVANLCRQHGFCDAKRLKQFEEENARLKKLLGEQALDISVLKDVLSKNF